MSPGGPAEVARLLGSHAITNCSVLEIGTGAGVVDVALAQNHGAGTVIGVDFQEHLVDLVTNHALSLPTTVANPKHHEARNSSV